MDLIEGLKYKYGLNRYIDGCLKQNYTYEVIFEYLSNNEEFVSFMMSRIGQIWLKKPLHGQKYMTWQNGTSNA